MVIVSIFCILIELMILLVENSFVFFVVFGVFLFMFFSCWEAWFNWIFRFLILLFISYRKIKNRI